MFALFYTFLYINDVKKRIHVLANPQRSSLRLHLCASERSERAIFGVFNSFTVKKVSFFTINVKFKVILSSKSGGGGDVCTGHPPPPHPKKWGGGGNTSPPIPPGIYASESNIQIKDQSFLTENFPLRFQMNKFVCIKS